MAVWGPREAPFLVGGGGTSSSAARKSHPAANQERESLAENKDIWMMPVTAGISILT